ncbi:CD209 antigen-like protein C [Sebastes fasciatus]|uniref:CD209 antigen-like protein C n=1 Tax=Sebastes fasciatus TaxID=394691 RepID=UPI003D9F316C
MNRKPLEEIEKIKEEVDYVNGPVCTVKKMAAPPDQRFRFFTQSFPLIAVCWLILLVIMGLRIHFTSLISEKNAKLTAEIQDLKTQNQELESQMNNWNELNASRAQWSIYLYCPIIKNKRVCQHCQEGWEYNEPSCNAINNARPSDRKTWEEAREDCRGKNADFAVVHNQDEKDIISRYTRIWIGLRVEDGKWRWIDGSDLTETSWIEAPTDGHCAISNAYRRWTSVSCDDRQEWICKKNALSF